MSSTIDFTIRKASVADVPAISEIIKFHAQKGVMLQRPVARIYDNIRDYMLIEAEGDVVGCGALHIMWSDLAEIRAVALKDDYRGKGIGEPLIRSLIDEARELGIEKVFVLTYQENFFRRLGFTGIDKSELPHKIWADCINCMHFPNCNEISLILNVNDNGTDQCD